MNSSPSMSFSSTLTTENQLIEKDPLASYTYSEQKIEKLIETPIHQKVKTLDKVKLKVLSLIKGRLEFHECMHQDHLSFLTNRSTRVSTKKFLVRLKNVDDSKEYKAEIERRLISKTNYASKEKDVITQIKKLMIIHFFHPYHLKAVSWFLKSRESIQSCFADQKPLEESIFKEAFESICKAKEGIIRLSNSSGSWDPINKIQTPIELREMPSPCPYSKNYTKSILSLSNHMVDRSTQYLDPLTKEEIILFKDNFDLLIVTTNPRYVEFSETESKDKLIIRFYNEGAKRRYFFEYKQLGILRKKQTDTLFFVCYTEVFEDFFLGEISYLNSKLLKVFLDRLDAEEGTLRQFENLYHLYNDLIKEYKPIKKCKPIPPFVIPLIGPEHLPTTQTFLTAIHSPQNTSKNKKGNRRQQIKPVIALPTLKSEPVLPLVKSHEIFYLKKDEHEIYLAILQKGKITWDEAISCLKSLNWIVKPAGGSIYKIKYQASRHFISPLNYDMMGSQAIREEKGDKSQLTKNVHEPHGVFYREPLDDNRLKRIRDMLLEAGFNKGNVLLKNLTYAKEAVN